MATAYIVLASIKSAISSATFRIALSSPEPVSLSWSSCKPWQEYVDQLYSRLYDEAYAAACEQDSPNSYDFGSLLIHEQEKRGIYM